MIVRKYRVDVVYTNNETEFFNCTAFNRSRECLDIYYSENVKVSFIMDTPDFMLPLQNIRKIMIEKEDGF